MFSQTQRIENGHLKCCPFPLSYSNFKTYVYANQTFLLIPVGTKPGIKCVLLLIIYKNGSACCKHTLADSGRRISRVGRKRVKGLETFLFPHSRLLSSEPKNCVFPSSFFLNLFLLWQCLGRIHQCCSIYC